MLKKIRTLACGLCLLLPAVGAWAQIEPAVAESLMKKSGLWQQLAEIPAQMRAGVMGAVAEGARKKPSAKELARVAQAVDIAYAADRLQAFSRSRLASGMDVNDLPALEAWFDSTLGGQISRLEEASAADQREPALQMQEGMALLQAQDATRRALLNEMVVVTRSAEMFANLATDVALSTHGITSVIGPQAQGPTLSQLQAALQAQRPQMLQGYSALAAAGFARVYATLPTEELAQYLGFLKSDAGRRYTDIGMRAVGDALMDSSTALLRRLTGMQHRFSS